MSCRFLGAGAVRVLKSIERVAAACLRAGERERRETTLRVRKAGLAAASSGSRKSMRRVRVCACVCPGGGRLCVVWVCVCVGEQEGGGKGRVGHYTKVPNTAAQPPRPAFPLANTTLTSRDW